MAFCLEKYNGRSSRHQCPQCKDKFSFAYYVDENGVMLNENVGRCNHESGCSYHYTPKQFFIDNPEAEAKTLFKPILKTTFKPIERQTMFIPYEYVTKSFNACMNANFVQFLLSIFDRDEVLKVCCRYLLGTTKDKDVIFWQIDKNGNVRTGKIMSYGQDGHRIKEEQDRINWVHSILKKNKELEQNAVIEQCLFGEHLLTGEKYIQKPVGIVESEKTAVICSIEIPEFVWVATGGKDNKLKEKAQSLKGRDVVIFPDSDAFDKWNQKFKELRSIFKSCKISQITKEYASPNDKIDIADWIIEQKKSGRTATIKKSILQILKEQNPLLQTLINKFELIEVCSGQNM